VATDATEYVPCDHCYPYVKKRQKGQKSQSAQLLLPAPAGMSRTVYELLSSTIDNEVKFVAKMTI